MKRDYSLIFFIVFLILTTTSFSQGRKKIDSLLLASKQLKDTALVNDLNQIAQYYQYTQPDSCLYYSKEVLKIVENQKLSYPKGLITAYINFGDVYSNKGDSKSTLENYNKALSIAISAKSQTFTASCYSAIADFYFKSGNYGLSLENYLKALKINEAIGDKHAMIVNHYTMGNIYFTKGDMDLSMENQMMALKMAEEINDSASLAFCYDNLAQVYTAKGDSVKALDYLLKSIRIREIKNEKNSLVAGYNNIGVYYQNHGQYAEANKYYYKVLRISEELGSRVGVGIAYINLGETSSSLGDYNKACVYFDKSIEIAKELKYYELLKAGYQALSEAYVKMKKFQDALEAYQLFTNIKDTILNESANKQMVEVQTKYDTEKKELQIAALSKDKQINDEKLNKQRIMIYSVSFGLFLLALLSFFVFRGYSEKKKANLLLEEKNELIEEKNKDITDSINYAKRIQKAILTSDTYMNKHLPDHFVLYKPKDIVSGDFYWVYEVEDEKVLVVTADCTGHGVPGAFMSLIGASKLNEVVIERKITQPDKLLNHLREEVIKAVNPEDALEISQDGMDISVCFYDFKNMKLQYAGANNSIYLIRDKQLKEYKPNKFPVGKHKDELTPFSNNEIDLAHGDKIYSFTDGYADQFGGAQGKKFKNKNLQELLLKIHSGSMKEQKGILAKVIDDWKGNLEQVDDILLIGVAV